MFRLNKTSNEPPARLNEQRQTLSEQLKRVKPSKDLKNELKSSVEKVNPIHKKKANLRQGMRWQMLLNPPKSLE